MKIVAATVAEFITMFGYAESTELSNLEDPNATSPNVARIELALIDATAWLESYFLAAPQVSRKLVLSSSRRVTAIVARYFLDTLRTRDNVRYDFEHVVKELELQLSIAKNSALWDNRQYSGAGVSVSTGKIVSLVSFEHASTGERIVASLDGVYAPNQVTYFEHDTY